MCYVYALLCRASVKMCTYAWHCSYSPILHLNLTHSLLFVHHSRYGGISVGAVNSQVRVTEATIKATFRDLKTLFKSFQV